MLRSKSFVKKTRKGSVVKVVREHYLRDDVWCGVKGCDKCKHSAPPLEACPVVESDLCPFPHYLVPDTNVVLHQLDVLEDASITNVILTQVVLQEVSGDPSECMLEP
jgi:exosome complex exonuclease DIS3/RRP44